MEHIDNKKLFTNLEYRFNYVSKFIGFGEEDIKYIHESSSVLAPLVPTVVDLVYKKLFSFDITKRPFLVRNDNFTGKMEESLEELNDSSSEQIKFRKDMLSKYLIKLFSADFNAKGFINYLDWVGKIHTNKSGNKKIVVDYIHINALFGYVSDVLLGTISTSSSLNEEQRTKTIQAFNKFFWIQNDLFTKYYVDDAERNGVQLEDNSTRTTTTIAASCCFGNKTFSTSGLWYSTVAAAFFLLGKYFAF